MQYTTIQRCYLVTDYIQHSVHFTTVTHLFCNWKSVPLNLPHLFLSFTLSSPLVTSWLFSITPFLFLSVCSLVLFLRFYV